MLTAEEVLGHKWRRAVGMACDRVRAGGRERGGQSGRSRTQRSIPNEVVPL